jgi:hypothetical protein
VVLVSAAAAAATQPLVKETAKQAFF